MIKAGVKILSISLVLACLIGLLGARGFAVSADEANVSGTVKVLALDHITVTPVNQTVTLDSGTTSTLQFSASAVYVDIDDSNNIATVDVTGSTNWISSNTSVATIDSGTGLATITAAGSTDISASFGGTANVTTLTVVNGTSSGGGGGGAGGGGGGGVIGEKRVTPLMAITSQTFQLLEDVEALSVDIHALLFIKNGTFVRNKVNSFVSSITVVTLVEPPDNSLYTEFVSSAYDIGPNGARFDPPALLTLKYDAESLPEGILESNLYIAVWNDTTQEWEKIPCIVDPDNHAINAYVSHLSIYAIMADTRPANLELGNLTINPSEVGAGEDVTVSVLVTNTGDLTGSKAVTLKIDNEVKQTQTVTVKGQESQNIMFTVSSDVVGSHNISIDTLSITFTVNSGTIPASAPEPTPTSTAAPATAPTSSPPAPPPTTPTTTLTSNPPPAVPSPTPLASAQEPASKPINRGLLGGLIAAVVVIIGLVFSLRWWRRRTARQAAFLTQNGRRYNGRKA